MVRKASTSFIKRTTPVRFSDEGVRRVRGRVLVIVLVVLLAALLGGLVYLGMNPPNPKSTPVEKVLPNDKFQAR